MKKLTQEPAEEELAMLDGVDQLLRDCQELLETSVQSKESASSEIWSEEQDSFAA